MLKGFLDYKPGLRHGTIQGVDQEKGPIYHAGRILSTSPPKSACPGVSTMLIFVPL